MRYGMDRLFVLLYCLTCCWPILAVKELMIVKQWAELEFAFPSVEARQNALAKRYYVPGYSVPNDVEVYHYKKQHKSRVVEKTQIFVTIPRFDEGRPVTLGTVNEAGLITAYPDYSWHDNQGSNCDGMTSVFRVAIDRCKRLWMMDAGTIGSNHVCPPQLLAFDLDTKKLVYRHRPDKSSYLPTSQFINVVVDVRGEVENDCSDTFVYVADVNAFGLLVVDVAKNRSWRVNNKYFYPYPSHGTFNIDGVNFELMDGVFGMALSPYKPGHDRILYFHALSSTTENVVRTSVLRNDEFLNDPDADPDSINVFQEERPNQSVAEAMDNDGILYFGIMDPPSIWCWNSATVFSPRNFHPIAINKETFQFSSGVKIVNNLKGEQELWVLTSSFQRVKTGKISSKEINFRIQAERIPFLLENSDCSSVSLNKAHKEL